MGGRTVIEKIAIYKKKIIFIYQQSREWLICGYFNHPLNEQLFLNQFESRPLEYWGMLPIKERNKLAFELKKYKLPKKRYTIFPNENFTMAPFLKEKIGKFGLYKNTIFNFDSKDSQFYYLISSGDEPVEMFANNKDIEYINGVPYYLLPLSESDHVELLFTTPLLFDPSDYGMGVTEAVYKMAHYRGRRILIMYRGSEFFLAGFFNEPLPAGFFEGQFEPRPQEYFGKIPLSHEPEITFIS